MKLWIRKHYARNTINSKWQLVSVERRIIADSVAREKFSKEELAFWRVCGSVRRHGDFSVTLYRPDKLAKTEEEAKEYSTFDMYRNGGIRERECLDRAYYDLNVEIDENNCFKVGTDEKWALWSIDRKQWVG